ncbi:DUF4149 domain-containing protein [Bradyrhizobium manausense]|uniref:DUF4149 domain-containing protein n=1 Tax=Bradyrhizobium manausense TaxID=989370 RepID=UPI001BAA8E52|nr:DUF4149 domain-containing protein [Bradyrhizobium manausense]MBR1090154.1 DUF4149 domain-containing protein [Bradyrhizobium manausense]
MSTFALLATALLFGGMVLYSFGFAAFIFNVLPTELAGTVIRRAFPYFYLFVLFTAAAAMMATLHDVIAPTILGIIAATTIFARQVLMPAINQATDARNRTRFRTLHAISVLITLAHIAGSGWVLVRLAS